ncbi:MAG: transcription termination/antitermination factor NusG [Clostridia bacterium]|nr:transcription termination/antitermination factor NusG [Clostridia bacterium]MBQ7603560.1 transcription termination/antitermination factor NusG [Clostridia bacterium]
MSDFDEISPLPQWYIVHTFAGYENKVKSNLEKIIDNRKLQDVIMEVFIPVDTTVIPGKNGEEDKIVENKVFPGYIFVRMLMSDETWHIVRNITGVTGFVGPGSRPEPISEQEVINLGISVGKKGLGYKIGDTVSIVKGPLSGNTAIVDGISEDEKRIKVRISMFGRETPMELDSDMAEIAGA